MKVLVLSSAVSYLFLSLIGYIGYKTGVSTMEPSRIFFQFWMILLYFRDRADRIWSRRQNIFPIFGDFVLLSELRGPDLELAVEHFSNFWRFCSTFEVARTEFGVGGRTFFRFLGILFYFRSCADRIWSWRQNIFPIFGDFVLLSRSRGPDLKCPVDKKEAFIPFFVYFRGRAPEFGPAGRQKRVIFPAFCLLPRPRALNLNQPVDKMSHFLRFLSTSEAAHPEFELAGRQKRVISSVFCLLSRSRALNFDQPVAKNHTFIPFFVCFPFELQSGLRAKNHFSNFARKLLMQHGNSTRSRHRLLPLHCIFHADKELRQKQIIHASPKMQCHPHQKNQSISLIF